MRLYKIPIGKSKLDSMTENERVFFIQLSHFGNEVNILRRLFLWSALVKPVQDVEEKASVAQALCVAKVLTGKLKEGWELLQKSFFKSGLSKDYESSLIIKASEGLTNLKKYFSQSNTITKVRNNFAFHYSSAGIKKCYSQLSSTMDFDIYLSKNHSNCFYHAPEALVNYAIMETIAPGRHEEGMEMLIQDTINVTGWFLAFSDGFMIELGKRYLETNFKDSGAVEIDLRNSPKFDDVTIPYFVVEKGE